MWFSKTAQEAIEHYEVAIERGLSSEEVARRVEKHGLNRLEEKAKKSLLALFFAQLNDMLIFVLLGAAVITLVIQEYADAIIILLVVLLNAIIGVVQGYKAEKAIAALKKMTTSKSLVRRDGEVREINSEEIVPGDIIIIDAGRYIPADLRLIETVNLQIEESALTGESVPSEKDATFCSENPKTPIGDRSNMAFMSTHTTYGRGVGIVVATGMKTEIGKIAKILDQDLDEVTPLQKRLHELGKTLGFLAIGICVLISIISIFQSRDLFETFLTAISLAVAAIPEGLPAIVAIVLALGVTRMSKINAIVKRLPAVETLGSVNIIASDKTGTLTQNKMTVVKLYTFQKLIDVPSGSKTLQPSPDEAELMRSFVLCSDATAENGQTTGDPTEVALVVLGQRAGFESTRLRTEFPRIAENPFDSDRKLMSTLNQEGHQFRVHTKGAIDHILKISTHALVDGKVVPVTEQMKLEFLKVAEALSDQALRVLGVAYKDCQTEIAPEDMEQGLTVVGFVGMIDPPRPEVKALIEEAKKAGITTVMITGDHKNTAVAIGKELGIATSKAQSITGAEIDAMSEQEFYNKINQYVIFARVSPEHKVKIVKAFKAHGNIVSMTGDGVNDAPSLKMADIGVAMGITGTDVSKGASDMILTDDNFTTIVNAIREGRTIYSNIKKAVIFLLACNLGEVLAVLASVLFFWPIPLLPTQILWINLMTDTFPAIALGVERGDRDIMKRKPRHSKESFFAQGAGIRAVIGGFMIGSLTLVAFFIGLAEYGFSPFSPNIPDAVITNGRTMAFVVIATTQLFYSLTMRNSIKSIFKIGIFTNKYLIGAIALGLSLQVIVISVPFLANAFQVSALSPWNWVLVILLSLIPLTVNELIKFFKAFFVRRI
ncbi:MAG: cation-translocating P-type ATPase [Clostridia bacterium]